MNPPESRKTAFFHAVFLEGTQNILVIRLTIGEVMKFLDIPFGIIESRKNME